MNRLRNILIVVALALTGVVATTHAGRAATAWNLVAMGDSITSGEGTYSYLSTTNTSTDMCHRSPNDSYAAQFVGISVNKASWNLDNVACSGAGVNEIFYSVPTNTGGNPDGELAQDLALNTSANLVVLTLGADDLHIANFAAQCYGQNTEALEDSCFQQITTANSTYTYNGYTYQYYLANLAAALDGAYQDIRNEAPNATVAVLTYPDIYPATTTGSCGEYYSMIFGINAHYAVTSPAMLQVVNGAFNSLNSTIETQAAKYPGFVVVHEEQALAGHDICSSSPWVNNVTNPNPSNGTAADESLHPTTRGYLAMAQVLASRLDPGYFSDGTTYSPIASAYTSEGGLTELGLPTDNGGGPYVHYWSGSGSDVEDFAGGAAGPAIMVNGPDGTYFVNYGFRTAYLGGAANSCGPPTDLAHDAGTSGTRQDFVNCSMTWNVPTGTGVTVQGTSSPAGCTSYGAATITGPNACYGFTTAPPAGKPASGNVWYSGGGVGLFGQELWTYANGTVATSTAVYQLSGLGITNVYQLQAYIPNNDADASHAHYHYCAPGGGCADGYVNQNNFTNQWATFGATCSTDGTATITLADDGGDVYPAVVGADAIRAVRTSLAC